MLTQLGTEWPHTVEREALVEVGLDHTLATRCGISMQYMSVHR